MIAAVCGIGFAYLCRQRSRGRPQSTTAATTIAGAPPLQRAHSCIVSRKFATGRIRPSADMVNGVNAKVIVMPKAAVLDPQGNAVRDAMRHLGMPEVRSVRIGKYMEIEIEGQDGELESRLHQLCRDLLSNPVIEDYELQQTDVGRQPPSPRLRRPRKAEIRGQKKTPNSDKSRAGAQLRKTKTQMKSA